jgi:hypothetical protein
MKDFTKTQKKSTDAQETLGAMKCNTCNYEVKSFGVPAGSPCPNPDKGECTGRLMKTDDFAADRAKRRTDGAA